jgi:hypothetical protein
MVNYGQDLAFFKGCGVNQTDCMTHVSNSLIGCPKPFFNNHGTEKCELCNSNCIDCQWSASLCRTCADNYDFDNNGSGIFGSCYCKPEFSLVGSLSCCDITKGEFHGDESCRNCPVGCSACISSPLNPTGVVSDYCMDDSINTINRIGDLKDKCKFFYEENKAFCEEKGVNLLTFSVVHNPDNTIEVRMEFFSKLNEALQ